MQAATLLKNNLSKKQMIIGGSIIGGVVLIASLVFGYIFLTGAFSTRANDEAPTNIDSDTSVPGQAKVTWNTGVETAPQIQYGTSPDPSSFKTLPTKSGTSTTHEADLSSLDPGKTYYFQIAVGDTIYDNEGLYWTFTTKSEGGTETPSVSPSAEVSGSPDATIQPTPTKIATTSATPILTAVPTPTIDPNATPTPIKSTVCTSTNCSTIQSNLGSQCTTQDYLKCLLNIQSSITPSEPTATSAPTAAPPSTSLKALCEPSYFQANSCTDFGWSSMEDIDKQCADTFTRYFVQCKSSSFSSSDDSTWYCNETTTTNGLTVPCQNAPTPIPGQQVFCRVRAETDEGGADNATDWVYANSSCNSYNSSNIDACALKYLQANNCRSWIWDLINSKDPTCKGAFSHYFFQCTSNGNFAHLTTTPTPQYWYCNTTVEDHFQDLPCYNAPTPADGADITCRVRAEDGYGTDNHSTAWITQTNTCPTSTPTPSITATPTNTPTPTSTPTPTPTI